MSTQMDKLLAQQAKAQQKLHKAEEEDKRIKKQIADLRRNERTHRLCTRGAYLEKLLVEPELFSDEEVFRLLDYAFDTATKTIDGRLFSIRVFFQEANAETMQEKIERMLHNDIVKTIRRTAA